MAPTPRLYGAWLRLLMAACTLAVGASFPAMSIPSGDRLEPTSTRLHSSPRPPVEATIAVLARAPGVQLQSAVVAAPAAGAAGAKSPVVTTLNVVLRGEYPSCKSAFGAVLRDHTQASLQSLSLKPVDAGSALLDCRATFTLPRL